MDFAVSGLSDDPAAQQKIYNEIMSELSTSIDQLRV